MEWSEMAIWNPSDMTSIGAADELAIATVRADGTLGPYTTIWVVCVSDDIYVRSYRGRTGAWFRRAEQTRQGRIRTRGIERDVTFEPVSDAEQVAIDHAYRHKYARYADTYAESMVSPAAKAATLRLTPR
jgi:hypothetical protein